MAPPVPRCRSMPQETCGPWVSPYSPFRTNVIPLHFFICQPSFCLRSFLSLNACAASTQIAFAGQCLLGYVSRSTGFQQDWCRAPCRMVLRRFHLEIILEIFWYNVLPYV